MEITPVTLTGQRAQLVPMEAAHAPGLLASMQDPVAWQYLPDVPPALPEEMGLFVQVALADQSRKKALPFTIFDRSTGDIVGSTRFYDISLDHCQGEIGWTWLNPSVWRTRINTECKYLLLTHCFETLKMIRVQLKTDARNERSQRALERIGAVREGTLRCHRILPDGFLRDSVYYSVIAKEWPMTKAHLERLLDRS
jgi:RimJ/RimL family protein N-acetyltransferase